MFGCGLHFGVPWKEEKREMKKKRKEKRKKKKKVMEDWFVKKRESRSQVREGQES